MDPPDPVRPKPWALEETSYRRPDLLFTPDGNPLVGPAPGLRNMWLAEGFSFGITGGRAALVTYLAQMMVQGEAEIDMASLDPKRFGSWMTTEYGARKNEEAYEHVYILHHPDEEREACRPLRTAPCYDRVEGARARSLAALNGWERPNYYAPEGFDDHAARSFRRGRLVAIRGRGSESYREGVGMIDRHRLYQAPCARAGARRSFWIGSLATSCRKVGAH